MNEEGPDLDRVVSRLLDRLIALEQEKAGGTDSAEATRGWKSNQLDARGNRGGIWYVVESRWSVVAIAVACVALGVSVATGGSFLTRYTEVSRELANEKRLQTAAIDDLRMEYRAVLRAAGVKSEALENHDISDIAEKATGGKP